MHGRLVGVGTEIPKWRQTAMPVPPSPRISALKLCIAGDQDSGVCNALCAQRISGSYPPSTVLCGILDSFSTLAARVGTTSKWTPGKNYGTTVNDSPTCLLPYNIPVASMLAVNVQHCIFETHTTKKVPSSSYQVAEESVAVEKRPALPYLWCA